MRMDFKLNNNNTLKKLDEIKHNSKGIIERSNQSIIICRNLLNAFKKEILKKSFKSTEEEIEFFKIAKQIPLIQLI